jgi:hypothetical protein
MRSRIARPLARARVRDIAKGSGQTAWRVRWIGWPTGFAVNCMDWHRDPVWVAARDRPADRPVRERVPDRREAGISIAFAGLIGREFGGSDPPPVVTQPV